MSSEKLKVAVLTVSDRASGGVYEDLSGPAVADAAREVIACEITQTEVVPDDREAIAVMLRAWADADDIDVILTTGGTGFTPRDVTPEATRDVIEREAPGLAEAMRAASRKITPFAMLSRAVCGIRGQTLIINLPGSPKAAVENLTVIAEVLPHAVALLRGESTRHASHSHPHGHAAPESPT